MATRRRENRRAKGSTLDWRNPDMPALRDYIVQDPLGQVIERGVEEVAPKDISKEAIFDLADSYEPSWKDDPSYFWGMSRQRRQR